MANLLTIGELLPHFEVTDIDGRRMRYGADFWQRRNLAVVTLPAPMSRDARAYEERMSSHADELRACEAGVLVTLEPPAGFPEHGVVIADRWGEVVMVHDAAAQDGLPEPEVLLEWLSYVQQQCPECQGEVR
jgi:hypothetical protein